MAIEEIVDTWLGTPYKHFTCVPKRGVDCALLLVWCWKKLGFIKESFDVNYYPRDWHQHVTKSTKDLLENNLNRMEKIALADDVNILRIDNLNNPIALLNGAWVCFQLNETGQTNHCALSIGNGDILHAVNRKGVLVEAFKKYEEKYRFSLVPCYEAVPLGCE